MACSILAEDSDSEGSARESDDLFSSPGGTTSLEEDTSSSTIPPSPKNASNSSHATRRLFFQPLSDASNAIPSNRPTTTTTTTLPAGCLRNSRADTQDLILQEVRKANSRLDSLADQLVALETRVASVETNQLSMTPSSSGTDGSSEKSKRKVPAKVSHTVRDVYKTLVNDDENFLGYDTKKPFSDQSNQEVVKKLVQEVTSLDSTIPLLQIRDAARRFFQTKSDETSLKEKGKYDAKVRQQRRRNRLTRKFESRKAAFLKTNQLSDAQRDVWRKVLIKDFISSEESGEESVDGEERQVIYVKTLPWRAPRVDRFFKKLDNKAARNKSRQSKQQTLPRVGGRRSGRSKPLGFTEDFFGFATA